MMALFSWLQMDQEAMAAMPDDHIVLRTTQSPFSKVAAGNAGGCWPHRQYFPQVFSPYPATPTPVPTGDVVWSRYVKVVVAHSTPAAPIAGAVVEAHDRTYDCCVTGPDGWCTVRIRAHDTHYVSVKASAKGFQSRNIGAPGLPTWGELVIPLEPEVR